MLLMTPSYAAAKKVEVHVYESFVQLRFVLVVKEAVPISPAEAF